MTMFCDINKRDENVNLGKFHTLEKFSWIFMKRESLVLFKATLMIFGGIEKTVNYIKYWNEMRRHHKRHGLPEGECFLKDNQKGAADKGSNETGTPPLLRELQRLDIQN